MDSGVPCGPEVAFAATLAPECYVRGNAGEVLELVKSPNGKNQAALDIAGWRGCSREEHDQVMSSRDCPSRLHGDRVERNP